MMETEILLPLRKSNCKDTVAPSQTRFGRVTDNVLLLRRLQQLPMCSGNTIVGTTNDFPITNEGTTVNNLTLTMVMETLLS
jgi:hypothetical protein